nr:hypothetical protein [Candidatus Kapabacteria bacterium]
IIDCYSQTRFSISFSQSNKKDWQQGEKQILESSFLFETKQKLDIFSFQNQITLKTALGVQLLKDKNYKGIDTWIPTDNELYFDYMLKYPCGWLVDPFYSTTATTQLVESFTLSESNKSVNSAFWDPITTLESFGFAYSVSDSLLNLTSRIGISLKQVRAYLNTGTTDDYKTSDIKERYKYERGISFKNDITLNYASNLSHRCTFELFSSFERFENWTVKFQNEFQVKIWEWLGIIIKADVYYDEIQSPSIQYKQSTRIGVNATI